MGRMQGKVAFVTGAARGQGRSHALRLAEEGADVVAVDVCRQLESVAYPMATPEDLQETVRQVEALDRRVVAREADVRDADALRRVVEEGVAELGGLDVVVANAGIATFAPAAELSAEAWREMIDVNLTGVWNTCQVAIPHLLARGGGSIVITSSTAGLKGMANLAHYVSAKHGVVGLMRSLAAELGPQGIRVNTVHPTSVDTPMIHNDATYGLFMPDQPGAGRDEAAAAFATLNLMPVPWVEARDISNAVLFLASDEARYITGATLPVDAGANIK